MQKQFSIALERSTLIFLQTETYHPHGCTLNKVTSCSAESKTHGPMQLNNKFNTNFMGDAFLGELDADLKTVTWMCHPGGLMAEIYLHFLSKLTLCMI